MGKGRSTCLPLKMLKSVFLLQMWSKTSLYEVFMHHFEKMSSASGGFAPRPPPGSCPWTLLGDFRPSDPSLPTPGKNPAGAHVTNETLYKKRKHAQEFVLTVNTNLCTVRTLTDLGYAPPMFFTYGITDIHWKSIAIMMMMDGRRLRHSWRRVRVVHCSCIKSIKS